MNYKTMSDASILNYLGITSGNKERIIKMIRSGLSSIAIRNTVVILTGKTMLDVSLGMERIGMDGIMGLDDARISFLYEEGVITTSSVNIIHPDVYMDVEERMMAFNRADRRQEGEMLRAPKASPG